VTFKDLKPGNYRVKLPDAGAQGSAVSMTTFVNGKLASLTVFPIGSSVGTFAISNAKDTHHPQIREECAELWRQGSRSQTRAGRDKPEIL